MYRFKRLYYLMLTGIVCLGLPTNVFADENVPVEEMIIGTNASSDAQIAENAFYDIKQQIIDDYSQLYRLGDFSYEYTERNEEDKKYLDINVYVDMTLTRHPADSPYVLGMEKALNEITDQVDKEKLQDDINAYIKEIEILYFNIPNRSTFTYAVEVDDGTVNAFSTSANYRLFVTVQNPIGFNYQLLCKTEN